MGGNRYYLGRDRQEYAAEELARHILYTKRYLSKLLTWIHIHSSLTLNLIPSGIV